jgi:hypothetical protein
MRYYSLDNIKEDLTSIIKPRAWELVRLRAKFKELSLLSPFIFSLK